MTWEELEKEIDTLSSKITMPVDIIVPISRGGLIPGRLLATKLHVKTMYTVTVEKSGDQRHVVTEIKKDLHNMTVLLVEDMLETGTSMIAAKEYLKEISTSVLTACLYTMPKSLFLPDYFLKQVDSIVSFPWE